MTTFSGSLDANVLLRLLLNDMPDQHAAVEILLQESSGQFDVADTAIIEIAFVLERHYTFFRSAITDAIEGLMSLTEINCNRALFEKALPLFVKSSSLSFEDCCLAAYAELNGAKPLWTFDRKLANQAPSAKLVPLN
ncbi:MAG TPA: PIN domain-containing protein [Candidatus Saccharimonadales bacterium]|nr:PIN domain-containing protein [Candidatus Saccharimonadales bacterium]